MADSPLPSQARGTRIPPQRGARHILSPHAAVVARAGCCPRLSGPHSCLPLAGMYQRRAFRTGSRCPTIVSVWLLGAVCPQTLTTPSPMGFCGNGQAHRRLAAMQAAALPCALGSALCRGTRASHAWLMRYLQLPGAAKTHDKVPQITTQKPPMMIVPPFLF